MKSNNFFAVLCAFYIAPVFAAGTEAPIPDDIKPAGKIEGVYTHATSMNMLLLALAKQQFETAKQQCKDFYQREALIISGRIEDVGKTEEDAYLTNTQSAEYITGSFFGPVSRDDRCNFRQYYIRIVTIRTFDGNRTRNVVFNSEKNEAISSYIQGKRLFTHFNPDHLGGKALAQYQDTGSHDRIANYRCRIMRANVAGQQLESCVIDSAGVPAYIKEMQLKLYGVYPNKYTNQAEIDRLLPDAIIDKGVFEVPKGITLVERSWGKHD